MRYGVAIVVIGAGCLHAGPLAAQTGTGTALVDMEPLLGTWHAQGSGFSTTLHYRWLVDGRVLGASNEVRSDDGSVIARYHGSYAWDAGREEIVFFTAAASGEVQRGRAWWRDGVLWHEAEVSGGGIEAYASAVRPAEGRLEYFADYGGTRASPELLEGDALVYTEAEGEALAGEEQPRPQECSAPEYRQFDFWAGEWEVTDPSGKPAGTNRVTRILKGCVLLEEWTGASGSTGKSFNIWSRGDRKWHQTWVSDTGTLLQLDGELKDGAMVMEGVSAAADGSAVRNRITWSVIEGHPDRVRQRWEQSRDDGRTWTTVFDGTYTRSRADGEVDLTIRLEHESETVLARQLDSLLVR